MPQIANFITEIGDHTAVYSATSSLSSRWQPLFTILGLPIASLHAIEKDNPNNVEKCFMESITHWLQCNYDVEKHQPPSWRSLVAAIDDSAGGKNHALAKKIAEDHEGIP